MEINIFSYSMKIQCRDTVWIYSTEKQSGDTVVRYSLEIQSRDTVWLYILEIQSGDTLWRYSTEIQYRDALGSLQYRDYGDYVVRMK